MVGNGGSGGSAGHWRWLVPVLLIVGVTVAHYTASAATHLPHDVFRRLYYLPIILAAFSYGLKGGVAAALATTIAYLPHALGHISHDPAAPVDKALEVILYNVVGLVTGMLVERERREKREHQRTATSLRHTLEEREALESELRRRERLAAVGQLSAGLAHEIRNPLGSIKGAAQILSDSGVPAEDRDRLLAILSEESGRLDRVLSDFLTFARPRSPSLVPLAIEECVRDTVALLEGEAAEAGVEVVFDIEPALPMVEGDCDLLRQLFWNLMRNGLESMPDGGRLQVHLSRAKAPKPTTDPGSWLRLAVADTGGGIAAADLDRLFDPFFTTREDGTGLGLAICHRIVQDHGGSIRAANRQGGGARFEVLLPVAAASRPRVVEPRMDASG